MRRLPIYAMVLILLVVLPLLMAGCGPVHMTLGAPPPGRDLKRTTVARDAGWLVSDRVALIDVAGLLQNSKPTGILSQGDNPVAMLDAQLREAAADDRVRAVIVRINSPGGTVTASDMMYRRIAQFRAATGKPVIALCMDVAASGGYYVACAADEIYATPTTITGSIGVIFQTFSVREGLERIGVRTEAIVSGPNKALASPLERLSSDHRAILQDLVDDFYARFVEVVRTARPAIAPTDLPRLADGRIFSGTAAQEAGLVDRVGDLPDAFARAKALAGSGKAALVRYHWNYESVYSPYAAAPVPSPHTEINLLKLSVAGQTHLIIGPPSLAAGSRGSSGSRAACSSCSFAFSSDASYPAPAVAAGR